MAVAEVVAHHRGVFALHQRVVVAVSWARFGELLEYLALSMAKMKTTSKPHTSSFLSRLREGALIGLVAVSLYLCLALFSFA